MVHVVIAVRITVAWHVMVHVVVGRRVRIVGIVVVVMRVHMRMGFVGHGNMVAVMMLISVVVGVMLQVQNVFLGSSFDDIMMIEHEFPIGVMPVVGDRTWRVLKPVHFLCGSRLYIMFAWIGRD